MSPPTIWYASRPAWSTLTRATAPAAAQRARSVLPLALKVFEEKIALRTTRLIENGARKIK